MLMADAPESRFIAPPGWQWAEFQNVRGYNLRYGYCRPENSHPKAVVHIFPGLSEFCEKYFETAHDLLAGGYAVAVLDWHGQGRSGRPLENSHKRHAIDFEDDVGDALLFVNEAENIFGKSLRKFMLAHSMGANIGLRLLERKGKAFSCAVLNCPMFGIHAVDFMPLKMSLYLAKAGCVIFGSETYILGGTDWTPRALPDNPANDILSSDPDRRRIHDFWMKKDPALRVGAVTWGWLRGALESCRIINTSHFADSIKTEVITEILIFTAGREKLVSNKAVNKVARRLNNASCIDVEGAAHEILMEKDLYRDYAFGKILEFFKKHLNPENQACSTGSTSHSVSPNI